MNKILKTVFVALLFSISLLTTSAETEIFNPQSTPEITEAENSTGLAIEAPEQNLYIFHSDSCGYCKQELQFLKKIKSEYPKANFYLLEISPRENIKALTSVLRRLNISFSGVPFTIIGEKYVTGFSEANVGPIIRKELENCLENTCTDIVLDSTDLSKAEIEEIIFNETTGESEIVETSLEKILAGTNQDPVSADLDQEQVDQDFDIPILGKITAKTVSLPLLTIVIGFIDGFNPCAMWVLLFLITLLLGMENKRRRWYLGWLFILTSGLVYAGFMTMWLAFTLFLGAIVFVRIGIGLVSIIGGGYNLYEGLNYMPGCKIGNEKQKMKILDQMKKAVSQNSLVLASVGIVTLAISVNLVELLCSAGLPLMYTQILSLNNLGMWEHAGYIILYIIVFMIDDLIIFIIAMKTLEITGLTTKYSKFTKIAGGVIMLIIGVLLIFKPEIITLAAFK